MHIKEREKLFYIVGRWSLR